MVEIPECHVLSGQIAETVVGKTIQNVTANASPHKFAWFTGDPAAYQSLLAGRKITGTNPGTGYTCGGNTEIECGEMLLVISTPIKYHAEGEKLPAKHQLLIEFDDFSHLSCTVQMWGAMMCIPKSDVGALGEYKINSNFTPMDDGFTAQYFDELFNATDKTLSVKAFLATEQRIPGLGNGVLQDILFNAGIHPRRKLRDLPDKGEEALYKSTCATIRQMTLQGGRDTEKDLFGCFGGYKTILSNRTLKEPCAVCGDTLMREAYLGGNIYYCPTCQPYEKPGKNK
jgi:formamidopyrimidine-DNA glycosylase